MNLSTTPSTSRRTGARVAAALSVTLAAGLLAAGPASAADAPRRTDFGSYQPGPSTAGAYGSLKTWNGDLTITTAGAVVEGLDVSGVLRIKADNVTVRRTVVRGGNRGPGYRGAILTALAGDQRGAVIEDVTVHPSGPVVGMNGIQVSSATVRRADVSGSTDGIVAYGDDVTVAGSWVHDLRHYSYDPVQRDGSHDDALQIEGGARTTVVGNSLSGGRNAAIMVTQNYARVDGLVIDRNLLGGGYLTLNTSEKARGAYRGFRATNNRFVGDQLNPYGVQAAVTRSTRANGTMVGNLLRSTDTTIRVVDAGS